MNVDLKAKLASLEQQRAKLAAAVVQLDGAIGFCKGLIAESQASEKKTGEMEDVSPNGKCCENAVPMGV